MKTSKIMLMVSFICGIISIVIAIFMSVFHIENCPIYDTTINIFIGIVTSALITFFTSFTSYVVEKKKLEKEILFKTMRIINELKINHYKIDESIDIFGDDVNFSKLYFWQLLEDYVPFDKKNPIKKICNKYVFFNSQKKYDQIKKWVEEVGEIIYIYLTKKHLIKEEKS